MTRCPADAKNPDRPLILEQGWVLGQIYAKETQLHPDVVATPVS
jgi:hypothetical protein